MLNQRTGASKVSIQSGDCEQAFDGATPPAAITHGKLQRKGRRPSHYLHKGYWVDKPLTHKVPGVPVLYTGSPFMLPAGA